MILFRERRLLRVLKEFVVHDDEERIIRASTIT